MKEPSNPFSLQGQRALVTGSESGLGSSIVTAFLASGATVVGADINVSVEESGALSPQGYTRVHLDLADRHSIKLAVETTLRLLGGVDVCINCAGIGGRSPATEYSDDLWDRVLMTNLTGSFTVSKLIGAHMIERGGGSIINIASIGGLVGYPGSVGYQASKGGVIAMTRTLAVEWGPSNVRVNAIAPGHIATELVRKQWQVEPQLKEFFLSRTPLGVLGEPQDIANSAVFLASEASRMITGQVLTVDGGYTSQ